MQIFLTANHHHYNGVYFFVRRVGRHVAEPHRRQGGEGEVHGRDVSGFY